MIYVLDTSAILIHYRKEPGYEQILALFDDPSSEALLSSISLAEFGRVLRNSGLEPAQVDQTLDAYLPLFSEVIPVDAAVARTSIHLLDAVHTRIPTADSLIAASAQLRRACLVHRDGHFRLIPEEILATLDLAPTQSAGD
jgi:predicted nucleic acid-binding protein